MPILCRVLGCLFVLVWFGYDVHAQPAAATFSCPAPPSDTCFFLIFGPNFSTRALEIRGGDTKQLENVVIGRDTYCYAVNQPVASNCQQRPVSGQSNE
jgi:hypothetical protein